MSKITITELPMDGKEWEKAAAQQGLFTAIGLTEGEILNFMEGKGEVALTDIVRHLDQVPWSTVIMGIGALIREGLIAYKRKKPIRIINTRTWSNLGVMRLGFNLLLQEDWCGFLKIFMNKFTGSVLFGIFLLSVSGVFAQDSDQSSSGSGVLVSPPVHAQASDQESSDNNGNSGASDPSDQDNSNNSSHHRHKHADDDSGGATNSSGDGQ